MTGTLPLQMRDERVPAAALDPFTRSLGEFLMERVDLATGRCTLELVAEDGVLKEIFRHERIPATALGRFDVARDDLDELRALRDRVTALIEDSEQITLRRVDRHHPEDGDVPPTGPAT